MTSLSLGARLSAERQIRGRADHVHTGDPVFAQAKDSFSDLTSTMVLHVMWHGMAHSAGISGEERDFPISQDCIRRSHLLDWQEWEDQQEGDQVFSTSSPGDSASCSRQKEICSCEGRTRTAPGRHKDNDSLHERQHVQLLLCCGWPTDNSG